MDLNDSGEFTRRLIAVGELFDVKLSPVKQALYFEALRDVEFADIAAALNAAVRACTFMPKPAELRKLALGDADDHAEQAWLLLRKAMRTVGAYASIATADPALGEAILAMFGSWPEVCRAEFSPEMWSSKRKEFGRVYRLLRDRALTGARYLPGLTEQANAGRLEWAKYASIAVLTGTTVLELAGPQAEAYRAQIGTSTPTPVQKQIAS